MMDASCTNDCSPFIHLFYPPLPHTHNRYRVPRFLPISDPPPAPSQSRGEDNGGGDDDQSSSNINYKKKKGRNKKRPRDSRPAEGEQLCRVMLNSGTSACKYGDSCKYSHDIQDYLKRKEKVW